MYCILLRSFQFHCHQKWNTFNKVCLQSGFHVYKSILHCKNKHFNLPDWFTSKIDNFCKISLIKEHFSFTGTLPLFDPWNLGCPKHAQGFSFSSFGLAAPSSQFLRCCIPKLGLLRKNTIFIRYYVYRIQVEVITSL